MFLNVMARLGVFDVFSGWFHFLVCTIIKR